MVGISTKNMKEGSSAVLNNSHAISDSSLQHLHPTSSKYRWCHYMFISVVVLVIGSAASFIFICSSQKLWLFSPNSTSSATHLPKSKAFDWPDPPPHQNLSAVARYVMHTSEWGSMSTISTHEGIVGYPFVNVFSVSDGPVLNSTGVPYFYLTPMELSVKDLKENAKASFTVSMAQSNYCEEHNLDPEDPRCAHIIFTGTLKKIPEKSEEEKFAKLSLFSRHPAMKDWPVGHQWFFAKLEIIHIYVLDYFGGVGVVDPKDYFATNPFV